MVIRDGKSTEQAMEVGGEEALRQYGSREVREGGSTDRQ